VALNSRCQKCRVMLGPEDNDGPNTQPDLCFRCRQEAAKPKPEEPAPNPWAVAGRQQKALAMAVVIDGNFRRQFPNLDPFDQAFRILDASFTWTDENWEDIGERAFQPNGKPYKRKRIRDDLRAMVRAIYEGRARAPLAPRAAS
jgi:hypothetical protein